MIAVAALSTLADKITYFCITCAWPSSKSVNNLFLYHLTRRFRHNWCEQLKWCTLTSSLHLQINGRLLCSIQLTIPSLDYILLLIVVPDSWNIVKPNCYMAKVSGTSSLLFTMIWFSIFSYFTTQRCKKLILKDSHKYNIMYYTSCSSITWALPFHKTEKSGR